MSDTDSIPLSVISEKYWEIISELRGKALTEFYRAYYLGAATALSHFLTSDRSLIYDHIDDKSHIESIIEESKA